VNELERTIVAAFQRLRRSAPATIEDRGCGRDTRGMGGVLGLHDADKGVDGGSCVAARQRADFSQGSRHLLLHYEEFGGVAWRRSSVREARLGRSPRRFAQDDRDQERQCERDQVNCHRSSSCWKEKARHARGKDNAIISGANPIP